MNDGGILNAREQRRKFVCGLSRKNNVITVKANIPGKQKNIKEGALAVRHFVNILLNEFNGEVTLLDGADGLCAVIETPVCSKQRTAEIENTHAIGRLIDIDVFLKGKERSETRGVMRKCFLCGNGAFVCARLKNHSEKQLINFFRDTARKYFTARLEEILKESFTAELNLENKFGLVTPTSQGSHADLNYGLMLRAQDAIIPFLADAFWYGLDNGTGGLLEKIRPLGIQAENAMLEACGGANAYKGLIFVSGVILAAAGCALAYGGDYADIFSAVKEICKNVENEFGTDENSFGKRAYALYKITGVRGHAKNGFNTAMRAEELIDSNLSPKSLINALCYIVGNVEDTVLLKRSGSLERYEYFRRAISTVDCNDELRMKNLNDECLKSNISIGGSADVLCAALLLRKLKSLWYINN